MARTAFAINVSEIRTLKRHVVKISFTPLYYFGNIYSSQPADAVGDIAKRRSHQ